MVSAMYTAGTWRASVAVPEGLIERLRDAAPDWMAPERYGFVTELFQDGSEGVTSLDFEVDLPDVQDLHDTAKAAWLDLLGRAGISPLEPRFLSFVPPSYELRHDELRREAQVLLEDERYDFAVLRLQTAVEVLAIVAIAGALRGVIGRERGDALARCTRAAMTDKVTGQILEAMVGFRPDGSAWWSRYKEHVTRRNRIAHAGTQVTRAEAEASATVVDEAMTWLKDIWAGRSPSP
jgi:hypothetical protein